MKNVYRGDPQCATCASPIPRMNSATPRNETLV
jgi:hypothetical protein